MPKLSVISVMWAINHSNANINKLSFYPSFHVTLNTSWYTVKSGKTPPTHSLWNMTWAAQVGGQRRDTSLTQATQSSSSGVRDGIHLCKRRMRVWLQRKSTLEGDPGSRKIKDKKETFCLWKAWDIQKSRNLMSENKIKRVNSLCQENPFSLCLSTCRQDAKHISEKHLSHRWI